jgi:putative ABC transport system permease protein
MHSVFGVPIDAMAIGLALMLGAGVAVIAALALRNLVFFRLGVRNIGRRPGRTALIVFGLMLATAIFAAALGTGDTMGRTVRSTVLATLGDSDEWVTVNGATPDIGGAPLTGATVQMFDESVLPSVERAARKSGVVDGVMPAIVRTVAVQDRTSRQTEPRVTLFAPDPARSAGFGAIVSRDGRTTDLATLPRGAVFLNTDAARALDARVGDTIAVLAGGRLLSVEVADVVSYQGAGTPNAAMLAPLEHVQRALGVEGQVDTILVSNVGGASDGVAHSDAVVQSMRHTLETLDLEAQPLKQDGLEDADAAGAQFMSMFSTFGSFSIAAGILLIFLIFVMLAAERRTEMGVARAIGTQRGHLVQTFLFEGAAYDLVAAAFGALIGVGVSFLLVAMIGRAEVDESISIEYSVRWQSVFIAYGLGVCLTFLVVAFSAWRVSVLNIVTAVRNLPEPTRRRPGRRGLLRAAVLLGLGALLIVNGRGAAQAMPFLLGASLVAIGLVPLLRAARLPDRVSYTAAGAAIVVVWMLPFRVIEALVPGAEMDFSMWIVGGILIVVGAVWTTMYNADALLGAAAAVLGRIRSLAAVLKISMAYPLRNRLRTGMTLAMFTLVVFNLVVGIVTPTSFITSLNDVEKFGGGYDVRAMTSPASPIDDVPGTLREHPELRDGIRSVASMSTIPVQARQGTNAPPVDYPLHGFDDAFLQEHRYALGSRARGYGSDAEVWSAIARGGNLAVVDPWMVPHRRNWAFGALSDMKLSGFYAEDPVFDPVVIEVRDPETKQISRFTVIGVLRDTMPFEMAGISTSTRALWPFGERTRPTTHLFALAPGVDPAQFASQLESVFLANGVQADTFSKLVDDNVGGSMVFLRMIEGFMGLGLVVGVAALGVIAARSVVERRQQIGVLRAIGFQASTVRLGFLLESGFLALTSIVLGTVLGLVLSYNIVDDGARQATWPGVQLTVPWLNLAVVFVIVLFVALATTYLPARRASKVYPAEALRYQ